MTAPTPELTLHLSVVNGRIEHAHELVPPDQPVDAVAVGHYVGVRPQNSERALDCAITEALLGAQPAERDLVLTQYTERGTIRGELGQPFFILDPRQTGKDAARQRLIVVAGMGFPGRFGAPELTVLARELCWSLGALGKRHIASVLIGSGTGNLSIPASLEAWVNGAGDALVGSARNTHHGVARITFVELSARRLRKIDTAIKEIQEEYARNSRDRDGLRIDYAGISDARLDELELEEQRHELNELKKRLERRAPHDDEDDRDEPEPVATRVTLGIDAGVYRFGAITEEASLPERPIPLDMTLVKDANNELAAEEDLAMQHERGLLLERLLIPDDLRPYLSSPTPLVMLVDSTTARTHWEMVAQPEVPVGGVDSENGASPALAARSLARGFLGTSRGLTRQLRTTFAPPPEAPPPPRRTLQVLVVADPAADARLEGAEDEGSAVAELFGSFNTLIGDQMGSRVEVTPLIGPREATRTEVMRHLIAHHYDVLHYAGHCIYEEDKPANQGWVFGARPQSLISANELNRVDRIPKFVFSNACQSGITRDRSHYGADDAERAAGLAPSFAESFFARGVANFICTAWPVGDGPAREFALTLYAKLLGLETADDRPGHYGKPEHWAPAPMHEALRQARVKLLESFEGRKTWGAYQHYGNPYFRLFERPTDRTGPACPRPQAQRPRQRRAVMSTKSS